LLDSLTTKINELNTNNSKLAKSKSKILKHLGIFQPFEQNNPEYKNLQILFNKLESERDQILAGIHNEARIA
jgi:hypothetical protein